MAYTDDWENLMNGVFGPGGKLRFDTQKTPPEKPGLPDMNAALLEQQKKLDEMLKKQNAELRRDTTQEALAQSRKMLEDMEADGLLAKGTTEVKQEHLGSFEGLATEVKKTVLGQDAFVDGVVRAMRRPFVLGTEAPTARNVILLCGAPGTGRHFALTETARCMAARGLLQSDKLAVMDLALYSNSGAEKLFLQDLYAALHAPGEIHILFNIAGSILVIVGLMLLHSFGVLDALWDEALSSGGIANVHTVFRLASAIVLLPVCCQFEKLSRKLVKDDVRLGENVDHELSLLDEKFFTSPAIALSGAGEAITTMARLARTGVMSAMGVLEQYDAHTIKVINENEEHIDKLADHVDNYLIRLSPHMPSGHGSDMLNYYIQCFGEFERIGDHAVNLTENAQEFLDRSASLSPTAHQELMVLREVLGEILDYTYKAFAATDYEAARHIEPVEEVVDDLVATLRANHIRRVRDGQCTVYAGLTFLDILVNVERIADQCSNVGVFTLSMFDEHIMNNHHDYIQALHQGKDPVFNRAYQETHDKYFGELKRIERSK